MNRDRFTLALDDPITAADPGPSLKKHKKTHLRTTRHGQRTGKKRSSKSSSQHVYTRPSSDDEELKVNNSSIDNLETRLLENLVE